jgi:hypothetical protein
MEQTLACAPVIRIFEKLLRGFDAPPALRPWNDAMHICRKLPLPSGKHVV